MNEFVLHPDPNMGIYLVVSDDLLTQGQVIQWAFELTDDERSNAYRTWREEQ